MPKKTVTLMVEFTVEVAASVDPNQITFDIPVEQVKVQSLETGKTVGVLKQYCTQEYFE